MSVLINESYANPNAPLWSSAGSGGAADWSLYPAINPVDLGTNILTSTMSQINIGGSGGTINLSNWLNMNGQLLVDFLTNNVIVGNDLNLQGTSNILNANTVAISGIISSSTGSGNGAMMYLNNSTSYATDCASSTPQFDLTNGLFNIAGAIGSELTGGSWNVNFYQSDLSQQLIKLTLNYNFQLAGSPPTANFAFFPTLTWNGNTIQPTTYISGVYVDTANYYSEGGITYVQGTFTDYYNFNGALSFGTPVFYQPMEILIQTEFLTDTNETDVGGSVSADLEFMSYGRV